MAFGKAKSAVGTAVNEASGLATDAKGKATIFMPLVLSAFANLFG